jgi:hypothetical protein
MSKVNARFWSYRNGSPVKITLKPEQELRHWYGGADEEGCSSTLEGWYYDAEGDRVVHTWSTKGRDCDGVHYGYGQIVCGLDRLMAGPVEQDETVIAYPDWECMKRDDPLYVRPY